MVAVARVAETSPEVEGAAPGEEAGEGEDQGEDQGGGGPEEQA